MISINLKKRVKINRKCKVLIKSQINIEQMIYILVNIKFDATRDVINKPARIK